MQHEFLRSALAPGGTMAAPVMAKPVAAPHATKPATETEAKTGVGTSCDLERADMLKGPLQPLRPHSLRIGGKA